MGKAKAKPDIIWILVDGVRPDRLHSCGNRTMPRLFLDRILEQGALFTKVITAGCNSKMSMHSAFTSLPPAVNRMNAYDPELQLLLDPHAMTLTDVLKRWGYATFRYVDAVQNEEFYDIQQVIPPSGFDVWESSGYALLKQTPNHSFDTPRRRSFIERFNQCPGPKFAYIHLLTSHEIYPEMVRNCTWTSEIYARGLSVVSEDFQQVLQALEKGDDTVVVVSTDHGVRLDCHLVQDILENGVNLRDASCRTFCTFIAPGLAPGVFSQMVSNLDIAPTILELAECAPVLGLGRSLLPLTRGEELPEQVAFTENVGGYEIPAGRPKISNVWGARTERWKYWVHETRGEFLADLSADPQELTNLIGTGLSIESELRGMVREHLRDRPVSVREVNRHNRSRYGADKVLSREEIVPEITVVATVTGGCDFPEDLVKAVKSQLAVYWELVLVDETDDDRLAAAVRSLDDFRIKHLRKAPPDAAELLRECSGGWVTAIPEDLVLKPTALYELRGLVVASKGGAVAGRFKSVLVVSQSIGKKREIRQDRADVGRILLVSRERLLSQCRGAASIAQLFSGVDDGGFPEADEVVGAVYHKPSPAFGAIRSLVSPLAASLAYVSKRVRRDPQVG